MRLHELFHLLLLLQFVTGWQTLLLLSHVEHHLLHCRPSLPLQVRQLRWLRVYLLSVYFSVALDGSAPPACLILPLFKVYMQVASLVVIYFSILDGPVSFLRIDFVLPLATN